MGVPEIRGALETLLTGIAGVKSASGYPPETVGAAPAAFVGARVETTVVMAPSEQHHHALQINVLVRRAAGNTENALKAAEQMVPATLTPIRASQNLGLSGVFLSRITGYRTDLVGYGGDNADYAAVIVDLTVHEVMASSFGMT